MKPYRLIHAIVSLSFLTHNIWADQDRYTPMSHSKTQQTQVSEQMASRWGLTVEEYSRYTDIMRGPLGHWNPHIDPLLALGISAINESKQHYYATLYAKQEYDLIVKTQAFEHAYRAAFQQLFPTATMVKTEELTSFYSHRQQKQFAEQLTQTLRLTSGDRLLYFPDNHCQQCGEVVSRLVKQLLTTTDTHIDIYVRDTTTDQKVRQWALNNNINHEWIDSGKVTLNQDNGLLDRIVQHSRHQHSNTNIHSSMYLNREGKVFNLNKGQLTW